MIYAPHKKWFTLVELLVVIVILALLWTISLLAYSNYSSNSRDSLRATNIKNIELGLGTYFGASWAYPIPDNNVQIRSGATILRYQWELWLKDLGQINVEDWKDPISNTYFTYTINGNKNQYQIASYASTACWHIEPIAAENIWATNPINQYKHWACAYRPTRLHLARASLDGR